MFPPLVVKHAEHWTNCSWPPPLRPSEVHVWRVVVPPEQDMPAAWRDVLTAEETERVARKRIPADARRTLASRACLRILAGAYLGVPPNAVPLTTTDAGKPCLLPGPVAPALEFNVSHSGDRVMLAFTRGLPVGIDIECMRQLEHNDLVDHFFSPAEREAWRDVPPEHRPRAFYLAWTRKEAFLKALGVGLSKALDSFSVSFAEDSPSGVVCAESEMASAMAPWALISLDVAPGYACTLAVGGDATFLHTLAFDGNGTGAETRVD